MTPHRLLRAAIAVAPTADAIARLADVRLHRHGFAEPGHDEREGDVVAFGLFHEVVDTDPETGERQTLDYTPVRVALLLNKLGVDTLSVDEWEFCRRCRRAVRFSPGLDGNESFWRRSWFISDLGILTCRLCAQADPNLYVAEADGRADRLLTFDLDLPSLGYVRLQHSLEFDLKNGTGHDPRVVASALRLEGFRRFLFEHLSEGATDVSYALWFSESELDHLGAREATTQQQQQEN